EFSEDENDKAEEYTSKENDQALDDLSDDPELKKTLEETRELSEILDSFNEYYYEGSGHGKISGADATNFEQILKTSENKLEDFLGQLEKLGFNKEEHEFAYELVESTDEHGFLPRGFIVESLADEYGIGFERAREIHHKILHLDPAGITAHNIQECLLAQIEDNAENANIIKLIKSHFEDLIHKRYKKIAADFNVNSKTVFYWKEQISRLDPKPGLRIRNNNDHYVIPDIILKKIGNEYEIIINDYSFPKIKMSGRYQDILRSLKKDKDAVEYVRNKINSAKFLIKSVYLRSRTLERVMRSIINNQPGFFYEDSGVLNPLTYSVIADELQVNESTISRVVRDKYADTPFGVMCLKDFFTSKAGKDDKYNSVSRHSVEIQIKKLIDAENNHEPISDQDIADKLRGEGVNVSRRVVAKYRKSKGILNSHLRRKE
ncbi:MAG TPA: RNA polymerase factor sigma-54, partial [Candidatus Cloacimonadota bacterium]|nr:RNA polymerase factor sigma-54 [Candidatus Cloacimonadota bacterium]